jgi:hypothetical protein
MHGEKLELLLLARGSPVILPDGQNGCRAPIRKINGFVFAAKHFPNRAVSSHQGALAIVTDAGRDAMDAM